MNSSRTNRFDLAIIGGGINGCGIARDAAGRGLSVLLVEQGDLAGGTSSASTKLIHGGLRYLEYYAFRLVRESLAEREVLLRMAPHIVHPLPISAVSLELTAGEDAVEIAATVRTTGQTGVEMEALTAASVAALTIYDMCKSVDRGMRIEALRLTHKAGGKSGEFVQD